MIIINHLMRIVSVVAICGLALMALLVTAGCSDAAESGPRLLDFQEISAEYDAAAATLDLPPGFSFPGMPIDSEGGSYVEGVGLVAAQKYWQRAWTLEWLEQRGKDPERAALALDVLKVQVPQKEFMTEFTDDSTRRVWAEYIEKAEMGDPSGLQQHVDVNPMEMKREN